MTTVSITVGCTISILLGRLMKQNILLGVLIFMMLYLTYIVFLDIPSVPSSDWAEFSSP